jgi:hypothetical protein
VPIYPIARVVVQFLVENQERRRRRRRKKKMKRDQLVWVGIKDCFLTKKKTARKKITQTTPT